MKTKSVVAAVLLMLLGTASMTVAQEQVVSHNTWSYGASMPVALDGTAVAVLENQIYVVGGGTPSGTVADNVQIYDPATNSWAPRGLPYR